MGKKITALVIDDSALMRLMITDMLSSDPNIQVIDSGKNGTEARKKIEQLRPDIVTLDMDMPGLNGLDLLQVIVKESSTKVIVVTGLEKPELAYEALSCGAVDFISKPSGPYSVDIDQIKNELISKVKTAAKVNQSKILTSHITSRKKIYRQKPSVIEKIIIIGASTGGPIAIETLLSKLSSNLPAAILIAQHLPAKFSEHFAKRLNKIVNFNVFLAENNSLLEPGAVYVAPSDSNMTVGKNNNGQINIKINKEPGKTIKPSIDKLMVSAANIYGEMVFGVILTGMGHDGTKGMQAIKKNGGKTFVQDEKTSVVFGMPKSVIEVKSADLILPLDKIAQVIGRKISKKEPA